MIDQRTNDQRRAEYSEIEKEKKVSLLREIDLQTRPHCRQAEDSSQDGELNAKHQNAGASTEEEDSGARRLAHKLSFQRALITFIHLIIVVRRNSRHNRRYKYRRVVPLRGK